jgi:hypothetical protein
MREKESSLSTIRCKVHSHRKNAKGSGTDDTQQIFRKSPALATAFFPIDGAMITAHHRISLSLLVAVAVMMMMMSLVMVMMTPLRRETTSVPFVAQAFVVSSWSPKHSAGRIGAAPPKVWIEEAEEGFVDEEENLEPGEVCLRSVKSFASGDSTNNEGVDSQGPSTIRVEFEVFDRRFLSAGALVRRPCYDSESDNDDTADATGVCDAWMADSLLTDGGPNLQLKGALLVLDDLFLHHLQREREHHQSSDNGTRVNDVADDSWAIQALRNFVVHCGDEDEEEEQPEEGLANPQDRPWRSTSHVAASAMAAALRGFVPLRDMVRKASIYDSSCYDGDVTGLVLDPAVGSDRYRTASENAGSASSIARLLPSEDTLARHTTKRFTIREEGKS